VSIAGPCLVLLTAAMGRLRRPPWQSALAVYSGTVRLGPGDVKVYPFLDSLAAGLDELRAAYESGI